MTKVGMLNINVWKILIFLLCLLPIVSFAAVPEWNIVPTDSTLTFTATQNDAPVSGKFTRFSGTINFDLAQLPASHVQIIVDMSSLATAYTDLTTTLITPDWFNVKLFPQAKFDANQFTKISDNQYQAKGTLTIRGQSAPVMLTFTVESLTNNQAKIKGTTTVKRSVFGVGQGEWASTDEIKDNVQIDFTMTAIKK